MLFITDCHYPKGQYLTFPFERDQYWTVVTQSRQQIAPYG